MRTLIATLALLIATTAHAEVSISPSPNASGLSFGYGGTSSISPLGDVRMGTAGGGRSTSTTLTVTATVSGFISIASDGTVTASQGMEPIVTYGDGCDADWADDVACAYEAEQQGYIVETVIL